VASLYSAAEKAASISTTNPRTSPRD